MKIPIIRHFVLGHETAVLLQELMDSVTSADQTIKVRLLPLDGFSLT